MSNAVEESKAAATDAGPRPLSCRILSVGDELVSGLTVDTNSAFFSVGLAGVGVRVLGHETIGDDAPRIQEAIRRSASSCDLLLISGGIGPTPDDLTRESLSAVMGAELVEQPEWTDHIRQIWSRRGRPMPEGNRKQASIPEGGSLLHNPVGTAAGVRATLDNCEVFVVPGVPRECRRMFEDHVLPFAREQATARGGRVLRTRAIHTFGIGESDLAQQLGDILKRGHYGEDIDVGTTASRGIVSVRIYSRAATEAAAVATMDEIDADVVKVLGDACFGRDGETLPEATLAAARAHTDQPILSAAESCTGGLIAKLITDVAGSSAHFRRGVVTYSNEAKTELLGVQPPLLEQHGAVSEPVAAAMAKGVRDAEGGGVAVSTTGIAGPGGGSEQKPVGTVCIGLATDEGVTATTHHFNGDRETVRLRAAYTAIDLLRRHLLGGEIDR